MSFSGAGDKVIEGVAAGLYQCGTAIMAASQALVPVDTGTLKRSGDVALPVVVDDRVEITVGYGYGVEYATKAEGENKGDGDEEATGPGYGVYVHEILENKHKPPTQAEFLKVAAQAFEPSLSEFVHDGVRAKLAGEY